MDLSDAIDCVDAALGAAAAAVAIAGAGVSIFGMTGDVAPVGLAIEVAAGSIRGGVRRSPAVGGAGIAGRRSFDASSSRSAAARVFMNPAA